MCKLIIAAGKKTQERLSTEQEKIKNLLHTEKIYYCSTAAELNDYLNNADTLVFYSDFPMTYNEVQSKAKQSQTINNVYGVVYESKNKAWLYDDGTIANCITPAEDISAIRRAVIVPKYVNFIGQWVAALLILFLTYGAVYYSHQFYMAFQETKVETTEEAHN